MVRAIVLRGLQIGSVGDKLAGFGKDGLKRKDEGLTLIRIMVRRWISGLAGSKEREMKRDRNVSAPVALVDSSRLRPDIDAMKAFTAVIERCSDTGLYVGFVPGFPGAHSQGETLDELHSNLQEVLGMLLEDGEPVWPLRRAGRP